MEKEHQEKLATAIERAKVMECQQSWTIEDDHNWLTSFGSRVDWYWKLGNALLSKGILTVVDLCRTSRSE
jgi:hypothetical protein